MKIRQLSRQIIVGLATLLAIGLSASPLVQAADGPGGNGLRVTPVRTPQDLVINAGDSYTYSIQVTNVTSASADLQAIVNDFTASPDESGNPAVILDPTKFAQSHSLKRFIQPIPNFSLDAGKTKQVSVVISVPKNAAAGGYYGVVRFAPASTTLGPNQNLGLAGSVGSLILIKVPGDLKEQLTIASFDARKNDKPDTIFTTNKNLTATVRFRNSGNVQEQPFGKILLKNRSGKTLATYEINNVTPPDEVLPDSIRKFSIPLKKVGKFGEYKLEGNFGFGNGGQPLSASTTFYVIPIWLVLLVIGIVALIVFLVFGLPRVIKAYNERVVSKSKTKS